MMIIIISIIIIIISIIYIISILYCNPIIYIITTIRIIFIIFIILQFASSTSIITSAPPTSGVHDLGGVIPWLVLPHAVAEGHTREEGADEGGGRIVERNCIAYLWCGLKKRGFGVGGGGEV